MENWIEFILARYNYWIVITLMMTGLYIVFARGNLVKKIVGLNLFQTSVFIFYITMGKIAGGTAPIYIGGELDHAAEGHGAEAGHGADAGHGPDAAEGLHTPPEGADSHQTLPQSGPDSAVEQSAALHSKIQNTVDTSILRDAARNMEPAEGAAAVDNLHAMPEGDGSKIANTILSDADRLKPNDAPVGGFEASTDLHAGDAANSLPDAAHDAVGNALESAHSSLGEVIYSNPLPHVLILTAIVVGVATTAVGLALAVRIREAYGTIEEDELETMDNVAEFGDVAEQRAMGARA